MVAKYADLSNFLELYFPIKIMTDVGVLDDIQFLKKDGYRYDPELTAAIFNGVEINTQSSREDQEKAE